jgi:dynein heavy chain
MATLQLYHRCLRDLKPTPAKAHYLFNVRDFFRVVSGVMLVPASRIGTQLGKLVRVTREQLWLRRRLLSFPSPHAPTPT